MLDESRHAVGEARGGGAVGALEREIALRAAANYHNMAETKPQFWISIESVLAEPLPIHVGEWPFGEARARAVSSETRRGARGRGRASLLRRAR